MKKLFSALLAVAMTASMASVALAAKNEVHQGVVKIDPTAFRYDKDGTPPLIRDANSMVSMTAGYGEVVYFALLANQDPDEEGDVGPYSLVTDSEMVEGMKVKVEFEQGAEHVKAVSIVKKKVDMMQISPFPAHQGNKDSEAYKAFQANGETADYYYFVAMQTIPAAKTVDADVIGTLTLNKSKKGDDENKNYKVKELETDFSFQLFYPYTYQAFGSDNATMSDLEVVDDSVIGDTFSLKPDNYYVLKYDYDDEVEFGFGLDQNEGSFTVDVSGQGKTLLSFHTRPDEALCAANPDAAFDFLNFNGVKFNRTGEFVYESDEMEYAYQLLADGSLKLLGEFAAGEVSFYTRVLGRYVFSDVELTAAPAPVADAVTATTPAAVVTPAVTAVAPVA